MRRALALATAFLITACAHAPANTLTPITSSPTIHGDFDGDGRADSVGFSENDEGALLAIVQRAATREPIEIWGGDISSLPYFTIRSTGPGRYRTQCEVYGDNCGGVPREVTLTHDGIVVVALEGPAEFLYYWDGAEFRDIIISE